jgi:hypothetical protein
MTAISAPHADAELQELVQVTNRVRQQAQAPAGSLRSDLEDKYQTQLLLQMVIGLSAPEIALLLRAACAREKGLALVRAGDTESGARCIREARDICSIGGLSREATLLAKSFQTAAEAYLQYRKAKYAYAHASLMEAVNACQILRSEYGYNVEVRRVHLARNLVRVKTAGGEQKEAMRIASILVGYVEGNHEIWPIPQEHLHASPGVLASEDRWFLLDQILGEIALLLTRRNPISRQVISVNYSLLFGDGMTPRGEFSRVSTWLVAYRASVGGDMEGFLNHAFTFFSEGPGQLPLAWRALNSEFVDLCKDIALEHMPSVPAELPGNP